MNCQKTEWDQARSLSWYNGFTLGLLSVENVVDNIGGALAGDHSPCPAASPQ